jgi:protein SCO1/2
MFSLAYPSGKTSFCVFRSIITSIFVLLIFAILPSGAKAHVERPKDEQSPQAGIGISERLGQQTPLDLVFNDEEGNPVTLKQLIHAPTLLVLVYYHCPDVCSALLFSVAGVLDKLPSEPGKEYQVLSVSFDEMEKPDLARQRKKVYLNLIDKPFPEDAWTFLTGDLENIKKLTNAVGFHFQREGKDFLHPVSLVILSSEGKIIRYLYGTDLLPLDLKMALLEASEGRVGPTISKVLRFCFSYDPKGRKYVFNTLKVTGIVTLLFAMSFIMFLIFKGKRRQPKEPGHE